MAIKAQLISTMLCVMKATTTSPVLKFNLYCEHLNLHKFGLIALFLLLLYDFN